MRIKAARIGLTFACLHLAACASTPALPPGIGEGGSVQPVRALVSPGISKYLAEPFDETQAIEVMVATNRGQPEASTFGCTNESFGIAPGTGVARGICRVNLPRLRPVGGIESDSRPRSDTHRYLKILGASAIASESDWSSELRRRSSRGLLVFIHGFNVKFEEAVYRAAQIAYDLKFQGGVLLLSWPAGPSSGFLESTRLSKTYSSNQESARASIEPFTQLLKQVLALQVPVYLTIHSMGHQVALPALAALEPPGMPLIEELFLNAPDFPAAEFEGVAQRLRQLARRITLYCSSQDNAMVASELKNSNRRLGACERFDGVDVINVGEVDTPALGIGGLGHGYYASRAVLTDIFQAILGVEARRRLFIRAAEPNAPENYFLRP